VISFLLLSALAQPPDRAELERAVEESEELAAAARRLDGLDVAVAALPPQLGAALEPHRARMQADVAALARAREALAVRLDAAERRASNALAALAGGARSSSSGGGGGGSGGGARPWLWPAAAVAAVLLGGLGAALASELGAFGGGAGGGGPRRSGSFATLASPPRGLGGGGGLGGGLGAGSPLASLSASSLSSPSSASPTSAFSFFSSSPAKRRSYV